MPLSTYARWRNKQLHRSDVVPGWLPVLIPYTWQFFALTGQLGTPAHSPAACSEGYAALCACGGLRQDAQASPLRQGLWVLASPVCSAIQTNHVDGCITVLLTWPLVAAMVLLPKWYVTRRSQLVALLRLCVMCIPTLLTLTYSREQIQQDLAIQGTWADTPGSTLDAVASSLGLAEYQLKRLLALVVICWTSHALLLPPAWEAPVSAVIATVWACCLGRVGLALGHPTWPWAAVWAAAAAVLCFLLPVWGAARRERQFQVQYQQLLTAQEGVVDPTIATTAASSSSSQAASNKGGPPSPDHTAEGSGPSHPPPHRPGSSSGGTAAGGTGATPAVCLPRQLAPAAGRTAPSGLYTSAGRCQQLSMSVVVEFAAVDEASLSQHGLRGRAAAVLQAAREALGLVCAHVHSPPAASAPHVEQHHQSGDSQGPVGVMASAYLALSSVTETSLGAAAGSATAPAAGVLVRLVSVADGADRVQLLLVALQQLAGGLQDSSSTEGMLQEWWAAVQQLLVTSVPGITSVAGGSVTACTVHAADQADVTGTGGSPPGMDRLPHRTDTGGLGVSDGLAGADEQQQQQQQGLGAAAVCTGPDQDTASGRDAVNRTSANAGSSRQRPPPGGSSQQPSSMAGRALQWAFQLQWHAPLCLPDPGPEAVEALELLLQLALQPAPGRSVGCNPYTSVAGNRALFAAAVATGSPGGASPGNSLHPEAPAAAAATAAALAPAAAGMAADPGAQWLAQSPAQLRGTLGELVTFLVTNEAVTSSWSWSEEEVLGLAAAQQQPPHTSPSGGAGTSSVFPVAVQLQLPLGLSHGMWQVHELVLTHRLPRLSHNSDEGDQGDQEPLQALALVPLCVLPAAAYQEVEQQLLRCMWEEVQGLLRRGTEQAGSSSSLQDYAVAFVGSSSAGGAPDPQMAAAEALTWHHWCQLAGDMNRAASLSRLLTLQALSQVTPEQAAAVVLCHQELQGLACRLLGFFLRHKLVACAVAVLLQMPPDLQQGYMAAVQQELAGREASPAAGQQQQEQEGQAEAGSYHQQQQFAAHAVPRVLRFAQQQGDCAGGSGMVARAAGQGAADAAADLPGVHARPAGCAGGCGGPPACAACASTGSLHDSAFEGAAPSGSNCSRTGSAASRGSSNAGSPSAAQGAT